MKGNYILTFVAGAAIGAASVFCYLRGAYKKKLNEAINDALTEMTKNFEEMEAELRAEQCNFETTVFEVQDEEPDDSDEDFEGPYLMNKSNYESIANRYTGTGRYIHDQPYIISPDDVEDIDRLSQLVLFADGVLVNELGEVIDNVDELVGEKNLDHFGERDAGPDELFVRNDKLDMDFNIIRSLQTWKKEVQ